jgi:Response regulator receiver domain
MSDSKLEKVLIIDDNSDYRKLIKTFITKLLPGVESIEYDPVFEGMPDDNFNWSEIDVLLLDYHLSIVGNTGLDILHKHHKKTSFPATIMLTGAGTEEIAIRALKSGIYEYQPKQSLTKDKLKQSIIHAWEGKKSDRKKKQEITQHNRSFSKEVFYETLEKTSDLEGAERTLVIIKPDDIDILEEEIGIIGRDNLVNYIAKNSFEVFKLGACNPNITRISDTEIGVQIDYPNNQETLEFNMLGLSKHLAKCTFKFSEEKYKFSVSIGVLQLGIFNVPAEQLIYIASTACKQASKTKGNSHYIWQETDVLPELTKKDDLNNEQPANNEITLKETEEKEKLEAELAAAEIAKEKAEATIQTEHEAKKKLEAELIIAAEAKEKAETELKIAAEAKEKAEEQSLITEEARKSVEAELKAKESTDEKTRNAKEKAGEEAQAQAELRADQESKQRIKAELKAETEEKAKTQAELRADRESKQRIEAELKTEAETKAKTEAEVRAQQEAQHRIEAELKTEEEAKAKMEAEVRAQQEAQHRIEAELKTEAETKAKTEAEIRAQQEAQHRIEAELKTEEEAKAKMEAEVRAQQEAQHRIEAELKFEEGAKAKAEAELRADQETKQRIEAELKIEEGARAKAEAEAEMMAAKKEKEKLEAELEAVAKAREKAEAEMMTAKKEKEKLEAELKAVAEAREKAEAEIKTTNSASETESNKTEEHLNTSEKDLEQKQVESKTTDDKEQEEDSKDLETLIHNAEEQIQKLIDEKRIIQTYQPITAMFDDENETKEIYKTGLQAVIEDNELNQFLLDTSIFSISLQQTINEWVLRQIFLRITESGTTKCQYLFMVSVTESWFSDISLFHWLQKILSQTKKYNPGKSILLNVPLDIFNKHKKRAQALIDTLHKSHQFSVALSNIQSFENITDDCELTSSSLLIMNIEQLQKLAATVAPRSEEEKENDEDNEVKQNMLKYLRTKNIRIITSGIEDPTLLTDAITAGTDYTIGSFVGDIQENLIDSSTVESFELT